MDKRQFLGMASATTALMAAQGLKAQTKPAAIGQLPAPIAKANGPLPKRWIDKDTGHEVVRISSQDQSKTLYFNFPAYTPDGRWMAFNTPTGISICDTQTLEEKVLHTGTLEVFCMGMSKSVAYARQRSELRDSAPQTAKDYYKIDVPSGKTTLIGRSDKGALISANADDTLFVGTYAYRDMPLQPGPKIANTDGGYNAIGPDGKPLSFAAAKEVRMNDRLMARIPMEIFTFNMKTGERKVHVASTDWLNHVQFSPSDPGLIMYCHEGPWHSVDRIWTIRTDGSKPSSIHQRTMNMEIAGHEFFDWNGKAIYYDLQTPRGEDFWLARYDLTTGKRIWYHVERNDWSVHFNISKDGTLFAGDGGDEDMVAHAPDGKWLYLFKPEIIEDLGVSAPNADQLVRPGVLRSHKLVNMKTHDYRLEPNLRFSPDGQWIFFRSNMHGPTHAYAVRLAKS